MPAADKGSKPQYPPSFSSGTALKILSGRKLQILMGLSVLNIWTLAAVATSSTQNEGSSTVSVRSNASSLAQETPKIKWYHPIKRALAPLEKLETQGLLMEQTIMKLTGPITELSGTMSGVDKTMSTVLVQCGKLKTKMVSTGTEVSAARKDIAGMRVDIHALKEPVNALRKPIEQLTTPLNGIKQQLTVIAWAIVVGGFVTAFGIPVSCIVFWKYRKKLIPQVLKESQNQISEEPAVNLAPHQEVEYVTALPDV